MTRRSADRRREQARAGLAALALCLSAQATFAAEKASTAPPAAAPPAASTAAAEVPVLPAAAGASPAEAAAPGAAKAGAKQAAPPASLPPAKELFGAAKVAAPLEARAIGGYAKGCLAGAKALAIDGPAWQAMRLSRNRNWGHPQLIAMIERLASEAKAHDGWSGLLVGDLSQPRGGPMLTGHASHQIGLDADIWFTPMPDRRLTEREREDMTATSMLGDDQLTVRGDLWTPAHMNVVKRAAAYPEVERVLVHPAIKRVMCNTAEGDRAWLAKVRPIWGHHYHFHIRMGCPAGSTSCVAQKAPPGDDGCGKELSDWLALVARPKKPAPPSDKPVVPAKPQPQMTLADLPAECRVVLDAKSEGEPTRVTGEALSPAAAAAAAAAAWSNSRSSGAPADDPDGAPPQTLSVAR
jgi:penicillin-insensitive murein endopeptidase